MEEKLRKSGVDIVGNIPWGTHFCQLYQTKEDLVDILIPYFKAGLENNEFCIWITSSPLEVKEAKEVLRKAFPDVDVYLEKGQIEIISYTCLQVIGTICDSGRVKEDWIEKLNYALKSGYKGLRLSGNTSWVEKKNWGYFVDYMRKMDDILGKYRMIALGSYFIDKYSAAEIVEVVSNHQFSLIKKEGKWEKIDNFGRKKAEEVAYQAAKDWEQTFDAVPDLITIIDNECRIVRANRAIAARLEMTPEECVGLTCYHVMHGTDEPPSFCPHKQLLKDGIERIIEVHEELLGGDFLLSVSPLYDLDGKVTGCVYVARDITERKRAEEALRQSEERERARSNELAVVLDSVPAAVWITRDPQALKITGNRLSYEWLRLPEGANASKSAPEGERPETFRMFRDGVELQPEGMPVQISAAGKEISNYEFDIVYLDGMARHILGNARPLLDEQGNSIGSVSAFIDITERKKAEEALKKAHENLEEKIKARTAKLEEAYKALMENERRLSEAQKMAHIGNWDWDLVTGETYWSEEMYRIFGLEPQEFDGTYDKVLNYIHPDDRDYVDNAVKKALNGEPCGIDYRIISADGEERVVHAQGEVCLDERNIPVKMRGTVQDITERKKIEEEIRSLANIVGSSNDAITTGSLDGTVTSWNKGAEQIYGYSAEEVLGQNISILEPENLKGEIKQLNEKIRRGETVKNYETSRLNKDGILINVSVTLSPVFDASGKLVTISVVARDITERIKAEKSLIKTEAARKKEIHHRIKNNLQVISSLLDLQAEKFEDEKVREAFRESQNRVISMALIHEELYEGEETDELNFSEYIKKLTENLFQTYRLSRKNIHLNMDLEDNLFFDVDIAVPLGIIVNELVSNSLKHAFPHRDKGEIRIKLHREEKGECKTADCKKTSFTLTVSDNGVGIPEKLDIEDLDSLGLQLVTSLVDQLDGELKVKRSNGTEFTMRFTVTEKNNQESAPALQQLIE